MKKTESVEFSSEIFPRCFFQIETLDDDNDDSNNNNKDSNKTNFQREINNPTKEIYNNEDSSGEIFL